MTETDVAKPFYQQTALELIDDPELPARESMDETKLEELAASISEQGLLQPIGLVPNGERYRVVYGHRRTMACRRLQLTLVPSMIFPAGYSKLEAAKLHENIRREELNAGEEAVYFAQLLEAMTTPDTDELARQLDVTRDYLENRLVLLRGDEFILAALKDNRISLAVAQALNRVKEEAARRDFLGFAISQGASARVVNNWRTMHEAMRDLNPIQIVQRDDEPQHPTQPTTNPLACILCLADHEPQNMMYVQIHKHCIQFLEKHLGIRIVGFFADPPAATPATPNSDGPTR